jgi:hypothetical protein
LPIFRALPTAPVARSSRPTRTGGIPNEGRFMEGIVPFFSSRM